MTVDWLRGTQCLLSMQLSEQKSLVCQKQGSYYCGDVCLHMTCDMAFDLPRHTVTSA